VKCEPGDGTFYAFPSFEGLMAKLGCKTDLELTDVLLQKARVAVVPGSAFGAPGYMRLSFATSDKVLAESVARIRTLAAG
jgi:aspartate aminotransferase